MKLMSSSLSSFLLQLLVLCPSLSSSSCISPCASFCLLFELLSFTRLSCCVSLIASHFALRRASLFSLFSLFFYLFELLWQLLCCGLVCVCHCVSLSMCVCVSTRVQARCDNKYNESVGRQLSLSFCSRFVLRWLFYGIFHSPFIMPCLPCQLLLISSQWH